MQVRYSETDINANMFEQETKQIAEQITRGGDNMVRRDGEEEKFSRKPPFAIDPSTGAAVKFQSKIKYWDRSVYLVYAEAFLDAQAEI